MQRHYGVRVMKNCLYIFILVLAGTGFSTVATGASLMSKTKSYTHFLDSTIYDLSTALITVGSIAFAVAILGCYAGINDSSILLILLSFHNLSVASSEYLQRNRWKAHVRIRGMSLLWMNLSNKIGIFVAQHLLRKFVRLLCHEETSEKLMFAIFLAAISVVEVAVAIMAGLRQYDIVQELQETVTNYRTVRAHKQTWDFVHREFRCCGTEGKYVWVGQTIPLSCCHNYEMGLEPSGYCDYQGKGKYLYEEGCLDKLTDKVKVYARILMGISIGSAFVKVAGIVLGCLLASEIKE